MLYLLPKDAGYATEMIYIRISLFCKTRQCFVLNVAC